MTEALWEMTKLLLIGFAIGTPLILIAVLIKPKIVNLSQDAKGILKFITGILFIVGLILLSIL